MTASDRNFIQSLERGLAVIRTFSREHPKQTVGEVAKGAMISRAAARRILITLQKLGYIYQDDRGDYSLGPSVLSLGYSYLSALALPDLARPHMERLTAETGHACSMAVLHENETVYIARVPGRRLIDISLTIGSRFPAHFTASGRVLLAGLSDVDLSKRLASVSMKKWTEHSITDRSQLRREIHRVRDQGYAIVSEELQYGVWAVAAPIRDNKGHVTVAVNLSIHEPQTTDKKLRSKELPALLRTAASISSATVHTTAIQK